MPSTKQKRSQSSRARASVKKKQARAASKSASDATTTSDDFQQHLRSLQANILLLYTKCSQLTGKKAQKECQSVVIRQAQEYLRQLIDEANTLATLKHKIQTGKALSKPERLTYEALEFKQTAMNRATASMQQAQTTLEASAKHEGIVRTLVQQSCSKANSASQVGVMEEANETLSSALAHAKQTALAVLKQDWIVHTMIAVAAAGLLGWTVHRALISTANASTEMLREAVELSRTVESVTNLVETTSKEGSKWVVGGLGAAVGAANGLLFSSLLPGGVIGAKAASIFSTAALGVLAAQVHLK